MSIHQEEIPDPVVHHAYKDDEPYWGQHQALLGNQHRGFYPGQVIGTKFPNYAKLPCWAGMIVTAICPSGKEAVIFYDPEILVYNDTGEEGILVQSFMWTRVRHSKHYRWHIIKRSERNF